MSAINNEAIATNNARPRRLTRKISATIAASPQIGHRHPTLPNPTVVHTAPTRTAASTAAPNARARRCGTRFPDRRGVSRKEVPTRLANGTTNDSRNNRCPKPAARAARNTTSIADRNSKATPYSGTAAGSIQSRRSNRCGFTSAEIPISMKHNTSRSANIATASVDASTFIDRSSCLSKKVTSAHGVPSIGATCMRCSTPM